jgi:hypothetical protein
MYSLHAVAPRSAMSTFITKKQRCQCWTVGTFWASNPCWECAELMPLGPPVVTVLWRTDAKEPVLEVAEPHALRRSVVPWLPTRSFGLSTTSQQYFSLRTNRPPTISQQYSLSEQISTSHQAPVKRRGCSCICHRLLSCIMSSSGFGMPSRKYIPHSPGCIWSLVRLCINKHWQISAWNPRPCDETNG